MRSPINKRYEFVYLFDVTDGNPNGDPENGNHPRHDNETGQGLVTDVCLKRKLRNYVQITKPGVKGYDIFIKERGILEQEIRDTATQAGCSIESTAPPEKPKETAADPDADGDAKAKPKKREPKPSTKNVIKAEGEGGDQLQARGRVTEAVCDRYYDTRTFGAVLTTINSQVRGPVQLTFARSIDPIMILSHQVSRCASSSFEDSKRKNGQNQTLGNKHTVRYALYRAHGFVTPAFAKRTGFSADDLKLLWQGLEHMLEFDHSASRGQMSARRLVIFEHQDELGNAPSHKLFDLVKVARRADVGSASGFDDYVISVGKAPAGVRILDPMA